MGNTANKRAIKENYSNFVKTGCFHSPYLSYFVEDFYLCIQTTRRLALCMRFGVRVWIRNLRFQTHWNTDFVFVKSFFVFCINDKNFHAKCFYENQSLVHDKGRFDICHDSRCVFFFQETAHFFFDYVSNENIKVG